MAFKLDDIIIDRIQYGVAEDFEGNLLYVLTQLADATIDITAESKDAVDSTGTLIKRFYQGKSGEFTANNAMLNLNILAAASGSAKEEATDSATIEMPRVVAVKAGKTVTIGDKEELVEGSIKVYELTPSGSMGKEYKQGTAGKDSFGVAGKIITPPTDKDEDGNDIPQYIVKYMRKVKSGVAVRNKADKFPGTVKLTLKALCVDPCSADTLRACYIELPSFQVSPEVSLNLTTDAQMEYKGTLQVDYCSADKSLYNIYLCEEDDEDEE